MYCERRTGVKFGWEQPKLPYHSNNLTEGRLNGNVLENDKWDGVIHDYQTATPELILTCPGYFKIPSGNSRLFNSRDESV